MLQRSLRPRKGCCKLHDQHLTPRLTLNEKIMASTEACDTLPNATLHMSS